MAAFATRRRAANSGAACPSALSGARRRARVVFTLMKPSAPPCARSFANSASPEHHPGFIDWQTYEGNQERIARNTKPGPHQAGGAVREGGALLRGLARCGHCGRRLHTHYRGRNASPGYHCPGKVLVENRGVYCLNIGGIQIDEAVTRTFVAALEPAGLAATLAAAERLETEREVALKQWRLGVERANYEAQRAERRYRAVEPGKRLGAGGLERHWEEQLRAVERVKVETESRER